MRHQKPFRLLAAHIFIAKRNEPDAMPNSFPNHLISFFRNFIRFKGKIKYNFSAFRMHFSESPL